MKTKNILKIGIFSIVIFALLISPILKSNSPQAKAQFPTSTEFIFAQEGGYGYTPEELHLSFTQKEANDVCSVLTYNAVLERCMAEPDGTHFKPLCMAKASFARIQCELIIGTLEGLNMMFGGIINSEIEWILKTVNPATYNGIVKNEGVLAIWTILRDIVNSLLILGLIGIAIATIVRYKKYVWQNTLWKLVIVALLVNFSLVITGPIVDVSNQLSGQFLYMSQKDGSIAPRIMKGYGYTKTEGTTNQYNPPNLRDKYESINQAGPVGKITVGLGDAFILAFITILTGGFAVIALLAIYLTMIVRNVFLIMLLGLSPIAFAAWIFPDTEKYWKMWWSNFIKWCFFPIIFAFTLYLGLTVMTAMPPINPNSSMTDTVIYMILFSMFLVVGLIFSLQSGGAVSKIVMQQASKAGAAVRGFAGYKVQKGVTGSETYRKAQEKLEGSKFAPLHDIGVWLGRQPKKIREAELKQIAEDYKNRPPEQIRADMEAHKNDRARVAIGLNELIERKKITYEKDSEFIAIAQNQSNLNVPGLKKAHRGLYTDYFTKSEDMEEEIKKVQSTPRYIMPADKIEATKFAKINLRTKGVKEADSDAIKLGNWDNILERLEQQGILENKGTQYIDYFFRSLWDAGTTPEGYAAMFRSMDIGKRPKWAQEFVNSIGRTTHKSQKEVVAELDENNFYRNRFLTELLPPKPTP